MAFIRTTAINKIRAMTARKKVIPGGTSASKTFGILAVLIDKATRTPNLEISVVSESIPHLRRGALKDFLKIMKETGRYRDDNYNRTLLTYRFINGSYIEFFSAQDERGARRNILFINECNYIPFKLYHHYAIRTDQDIYLDYNPSNEFWVDTELVDDPDVEFLRLTYKDNEALADSIVKDIESAKLKAYNDPEGDIYDPKNIADSYWDNWWKVYGLGLTGKLEGVIFTNWEIIKELPNTARLLCHGLDFGYSNNQAALVGLYMNNQSPIFDEEVYNTGLTNPDLCDEMVVANVKKHEEIIADSAEPKSIEEIKRLGWRIYPSSKGADSINYGIDVMKEQKFYVTERSLNMIRELRGYVWATDKLGNPVNPPKPVKRDDHAIDGSRYAAMEKLGHKTTGTVMQASGYRKRGR